MAKKYIFAPTTIRVHTVNYGTVEQDSYYTGLTCSMINRNNESFKELKNKKLLNCIL